MIKALITGVFAALLLGGGAALAGKIKSSVPGHDYPEAESFSVSDDAQSDVDAALADAAKTNKRVLLVMGANWCHDSRALAGWLATDRFKALIDDKYELVFVNIGMPQSGDGHNLAIAKRFGLDDLPGTPNLLVLTAQGVLVNKETATTWRNTASREEDAIFEELALLADKAA